MSLFILCNTQKIQDWPFYLDAKAFWGKKIESIFKTLGWKNISQRGHKITLTKKQKELID